MSSKSKNNFFILFINVAIVIMISLFISNVFSIKIVAEASNKADYMSSYKKLEKKCKKKFKYSGSQFEMNKESYEEYKLWDKELNKDYKKIIKTLTSKKLKKLVVSERNWIKKRDKKAKKESADWKGGSGYAMIYNLSLTKQTKSRIKWLIKNYA